MEPLPELEQAHLLAMFAILIYMKGQGAILRDVGDTNWRARRTISGMPEMVLLDAGSWTSVEPGPLKNLSKASGFGDILNRRNHHQVKSTICKILEKA